MLSSAEISFYSAVDFADPLATLVERAGAKPVYVTGALHLAPRLSDELITRFARRHPHAIFVNARGRYHGANDWFRRWRQERQRYGAAIVLTAGESTDDEASPCDDPGLPASLGLHAVGLSVLTEIEDLVRLERPILWHPVSPWHSALIPRFVVEGLTWVSSSHAARLLPASDAAEFRPVFSDHFLVSPPCDAGSAGQ